MLNSDANERPSLAPELVDAVAAHLQDDPDTLCSASLVSRTWCQAMRPHLFRHLAIDFEGGSAAAQARVLQRLADYMAGGTDEDPASPELALYPRTLYINADAVQDSGKVQQRLGVLNAAVALIQALVRRGRLAKLDVAHAERPLDPHLVDALESVLTTQALKTVSLEGSVIPGRLITAALSISSLDALTVHCPTSPFAYPRAPPRSVVLKSLACTGADQTLEALHFAGPHQRRDEPEEPIDASMFPNLRMMICLIGHTSEYSGVPWLCSFLANAAEGHHPLQELAVSLYLKSSQSMALVLHSPTAAAAATMQSTVPPGMPAWVAGLDMLDLTLAKFGELRTFHMNLMGEESAREEHNRFLPQLFPALRAKGVAIVSFDLTSP
ncbi:hypothetical protein HDZ31DRAFT_64258 [Schizophyllum fasciatum]